VVVAAEAEYVAVVAVVVELRREEEVATEIVFTKESFEGIAVVQTTFPKAVKTTAVKLTGVKTAAKTLEAATTAPPTTATTAPTCIHG